MVTQMLTVDTVITNKDLGVLALTDVLSSVIKPQIY